MLSSGEQDKTSQAMPFEERAGEQTASVAASERPLVVVIENTEAADMLSLQDLILVLSEVRYLHSCAVIQTVHLTYALSPRTRAHVDQQEWIHSRIWTRLLFNF